MRTDIKSAHKDTEKYSEKRIIAVNYSFLPPQNTVTMVFHRNTMSVRPAAYRCSYSGRRTYFLLVLTSNSVIRDVTCSLP